MKKLYLLIWMIFFNFYSRVFADTWIFWTCATETKIRKWDLHLWDIPCVIRYSIDFFMWIAWTIAIIFIIIWAYQMLFWSLEKDVTKWRNTILYALAWFALAASAWLIIKFILDNLW